MIRRCLLGCLLTAWMAVASEGLGAEPDAPIATPNDLAWMRGANYVPSYARNDVQTWMDYDPAVIDRELGYAAKVKLNVVRVFLQVAVYEAAPQRFLGKPTLPKSSASFEFSGDHVTCIHKVGPDCGVAEVLIDGQPAKTPEIDTYAPQVDWNQRTKLAVDLVPGKHVVTVRVAARKNPTSSNCFVQIVGFTTE